MRLEPLVTGLLCAFAATAASNPSTVTFNKDIAPLLARNCQGCHRPGEAAPFSLLSYDDVKRRGTLIAKAVTSRAMPPWKAVASDYAYQDDRRLSEGASGRDWHGATLPRLRWVVHAATTSGSYQLFINSRCHGELAMRSG